MNEYNSTMDYDLDDPLQNADLQVQKPKRPKRPKKSVNENLEPAYIANTPVILEQTQYPPVQEFGSGGFRTAGEDTSLHNGA